MQSQPQYRQDFIRMHGFAWKIAIMTPIWPKLWLMCCKHKPIDSIPFFSYRELGKGLHHKWFPIHRRVPLTEDEQKVTVISYLSKSKPDSIEHRGCWSDDSYRYRPQDHYTDYLPFWTSPPRTVKTKKHWLEVQFQQGAPDTDQKETFAVNIDIDDVAHAILENHATSFATAPVLFEGHHFRAGNAEGAREKSDLWKWWSAVEDAVQELNLPNEVKHIILNKYMLLHLFQNDFYYIIHDASLRKESKTQEDKLITDGPVYSVGVFLLHSQNIDCVSLWNLRLWTDS